MIEAERANWLAEQFESNRAHLGMVAYRMLGSLSEAEDAVQESWLRLNRSDTSGVKNLGGWLTTVVARVCLDMLRTRESRREEPLGLDVSDSLMSLDVEIDPEHQALMADSVGLALLVVLETLTPAERLAFVLHDLFAVSFEEIAPIVGRTPLAARQLASRARRRIQGAPLVSNSDTGHRRRIVSAFLAASRDGNMAALLSMLDPEVVLRSDPAAVEAGAPAEVVGAGAVAGTFSGRARVAQLAMIGGEVGAAWAVGGQPRIVFGFTIEGEKITEVYIQADAEVLSSVSFTLTGE